MARLNRSLLLVLSSLLASSGCTLWFLLNEDPEGLPCDEPPTECLAGYTCVDGRCLRAAVGGVGDQCQEDGECTDGLVCTNAYDEGSCGADINCSLGRSDPDGATLRCRRVCNPNDDPRDTCAPGERCFPDEKGQGWCQQGTCTGGSDCGRNDLNDLQNVCVGASINPTGSGLCTYGCDPLGCNPLSGCPDCPQANAAGQAAVFGCEPYEGVLYNVGCIEAGSVPHGGPCDVSNAFCQAGAFCLFDGGQTGRCARFCRVGGGNPECDAGQACNPITNQFGYCS
ncbi:MAG: hypothetical protein ACO3JL_03270 [Myxococcota bacterium]